MKSSYWERTVRAFTTFNGPCISISSKKNVKGTDNGIDLKLNHAQDTLVHLQKMWSRPVHIETVVDDKPTLLSFDGTDHTAQTIGETDDNRKPSPKTR